VEHGVALADQKDNIMHYLALLIRPEQADTTHDPTEEMARYRQFHDAAAAAISAGDSLTPAATGVRITGGPDHPVITDGPFAEGAEVAGGYYVFDAENLDDAIALAQQIPLARYGAVEVRPMVVWNAPTQAVGDDWLALLLEPPENVEPPTAEQLDACHCKHAEFGRAAGDHILAGAPLHGPETATTVRVRDGNVVLTDGPFAEGAEVASGFYLLRATDKETAVKVAAMIPASAVELRRLTGVSGL
jgi:hypothetical protein